MKLQISALLAGLILAGCGGGAAPNREPVYKVTGKVMHNGKPVGGADVTFYSQSVERSAFGRTAEDGTFSLMTFMPNDGAVAGRHSVTVSKIEAAPPVVVADISSDAYRPPQPGDDRKIKPKNGIPTKYADPKTTDLFAVISEDGNNPEIVLELK